MRSILQSPLVGAHFRPPAKQLLAMLASGTALQLIEEPENPYDSKAVKVMLDPRQLVSLAPEDREFLALELLTCGQDLEEILNGEPVQLGYVISSGNKKLAGWDSNERVLAAIAQGPCAASLGFAPDGSPLVVTRRLGGPENE